MALPDRRGFVIIYTGDGKGKTTAALGCALRAVGHGWKVRVIQFFKGDWPIVFGEVETAKRLAPSLEVLQLGKGFVKIMGDIKPYPEHIEAAHQALEVCRETIRSGEYDLVILDEVNYAIKHLDIELIQLKDVVALLKDKPPHVHVILTGRDAHPDLIEMADLVTEMKEIKHPFQQGIPAQEGIDY